MRFDSKEKKIKQNQFESNDLILLRNTNASRQSQVRVLDK